MNTNEKHIINNAIVRTIDKLQSSGLDVIMAMVPNRKDGALEYRVFVVKNGFTSGVTWSRLFCHAKADEFGDPIKGTVDTSEMTFDLHIDLTPCLGKSFDLPDARRNYYHTCSKPVVAVLGTNYANEHASNLSKCVSPWCKICADNMTLDFYAKRNHTTDVVLSIKVAIRISAPTMLHSWSEL